VRVTPLEGARVSPVLSPLPDNDEQLFGDIASMIESARRRAAAAVNSELVMLYWGVGKRIREDVLGGERAEYGQAVVRRLAERLTAQYGRGYTYTNLTRMVKFAGCCDERPIVAPLAQQLSWSAICIALTLTDQGERDFYLTLAARERWSKRALRAKIDGKLYERTIEARGGVEGLEDELAALRDTGAAPGLVFREPYVLDFLGLPPSHSEADCGFRSPWTPIPVKAITSGAKRRMSRSAVPE